MRYSIDRARVVLRQWRQPAAFRIEPPRCDREHRILQERLLSALTEAAAPPRDRRRTPAEPTEVPVASPGLIDEKALAGAATSFWRARERLGHGATEASPQRRQANRHLETSQDRLAEAGLLIQDHTGSQFHPGLSLEVLDFVDDPTLSEPTVVQTIKPCVYLHDRRIQMAQVIVGQPPAPAESDSAAKGADLA